jgi:hypothetical protein
MLHIILKLVGSIIMLCGVVLVYDARIITKRYFKNENQNSFAKKSKIIGTIICVSGGIIVFWA